MFKRIKSNIYSSFFQVVGTKNVIETDMNYDEKNDTIVIDNIPYSGLNSLLME